MSENTMNNSIKNISDNFIKNIEFAKAYCDKNRLVLVRVDVPPRIYYALEKCCYNSKPRNRENLFGHLDIEQLCGIPISINIHIRKPQYIMEATSDDFI